MKGSNRGQANNPGTKRCRHCRAVFTPRRDWQVFCSTLCRQQDWLRRKINREVRRILRLKVK